MDNCAVQTWAPELVRPAGPPNWCSEPLQWPGAGARRLKVPNKKGPAMDQETNPFEDPLNNHPNKKTTSQ